MNSEFGNLGWQIFVYLSYGIVGLSLILYTAYACVARIKSLKSLYEEGFLENTPLGNENETH